MTNVGIGDLSGGGSLYGFGTSSRPITGNRIGVQVGQPYTAQASFKPETTVRDVRVSMRWYNEDRSLIQTSVGDPVTESLDDWVTAFVSDEAPLLSRAVDVVIEVLGCAQNENHYVDTVQVERKQYMTSWQIGSSTRANETLEAAGIETSRTYEFDFVYQHNVNWLSDRFIFLHGDLDVIDSLSAYVTPDGEVRIRVVDGIGRIGEAGWDLGTHGMVVGLRYKLAFVLDELHRTVQLFVEGISKGKRALNAFPAMGVIHPFWLGGLDGEHLNTIWHTVKISTNSRDADGLRSASLTHDRDTIFLMDFNRILDSTRQVSLPGKEDLLYRINNLNTRLKVLER